MINNEERRMYLYILIAQWIIMIMFLWGYFFSNYGYGVNNITQTQSGIQNTNQNIEE